MRLFKFSHSLYFFTYSTISIVCLVFLLAFGINPPAAFSEDESSQTQEQDPGKKEVETMEPVVVSATKTPVPVSHVTSAVEVITGEDLQRRKLKTVVDALRLSQNLAVFSNGGPGTNVTVRIRGGTAGQTLVLVDGAIMNSATTGSYSFANLTTDNIERIEILRGAQSMLWGADAIGGVINITTKRGKGAPRVSGFSEFGSYVSLREGGTISGQQGPVDFAMSLSRWDFSGFSAINYRRGSVEDDAFRNWQASARLGIALPMDGRFEFNFRGLNGDTLFDNASTFNNGPFDIFKAKSTSRQFVFSGNYQQPITSWWSQKLTLSRAQNDTASQAGTTQRSVVTGVVSPASTFNNTEINTLSNRIEWQHNFEIIKPLALNVGYQFREQQGENISSSAIPQTIISNHSGFAQVQLNLWERIFATAGIRQDSFNTFGDATTYRVTGGYLHKETGTKIRGTYATGFRAPSINELAFPNFGNPNLQSEKSQGLDFGIDQFLFGEKVKMTVAYFWNRFRNLISSSPNAAVCGVGAFGTNSCAQNIGAAVAKGWELALTYNIVRNYFLLKNLELRFQYTNTLTRDLEQDSGTRLARWPVDQASGVLSYQPIEPIRMNLAFRYVGSRFNRAGDLQPLPAFDVWTLSGTYDVNDQVQVYTRVENLFNEKYEEVMFFGTPIRSIYGGIQMNFDIPFLSSSTNAQS